MRTIIFKVVAIDPNIPTPPAADWIVRAEESLRAAGHRSSAPRSAVLELIGNQECVLSAREIADELRDRGRPVGVATVYRTLEVLEAMRLVQRLDVGDGSARYEPALPGGEHHHHHLICDSCGRVTPFEDPRLERAIDDLGRRLDYAVGDHDVILRGVCPQCGRKG
ncbi:MAG: Fur family transcriptional regulator [Solirubrobacterales bacterium]|nr:transcriptional repressor [Solirubrobacterales bacterium]